MKILLIPALVAAALFCGTANAGAAGVNDVAKYQSVAKKALQELPNQDAVDFALQAKQIAKDLGCVNLARRWDVLLTYTDKDAPDSAPAWVLSALATTELWDTAGECPLIRPSSRYL